jgi:hypothetical protein
VYVFVCVCVCLCMCVYVSHRSLHCLPVRPSSKEPTRDHFLVPCLVTISKTLTSSSYSVVVWSYSGVAVVLQRCYSGVIWCYSVLHWCYLAYVQISMAEFLPCQLRAGRMQAQLGFQVNLGRLKEFKDSQIVKVNWLNCKGVLLSQYCCHSVVTVLLQCCYSVVTLLLP